MAKQLAGIARIFAENLKFYRNRVGLSQLEVAQKLALAVTTISGWETGTQPGFDYVDKLAALYGISAEEFFTPRDKPNKISVSNEADFVRAIRAVVESPYVLDISTSGLEFFSEDTFPKVVLSMDFESVFTKNDVPSFMQGYAKSGLNNALDLLVAMNKARQSGSLKPELFEYVIDNAIKDLENKE